MMTSMSSRDAKIKLLDIEDSISFLLEEYCRSTGETTDILFRKLQTILKGLEMLHVRCIKALSKEEALALSERFYSLFTSIKSPPALLQSYSGYMSLMKASSPA